MVGMHTSRRILSLVKTKPTMHTITVMLELYSINLDNNIGI